MNKFKEFCENTKTKAIVAAGTVASVTAACAVPALAEATAAPNAAVVDALTKTSNDMLATGTAVVPFALAVIGLSLVVTFGIKIFKRVANKG